MNDVAALRTSPCSKWSRGKASSTSSGLGRMSGGSTRSSMRAPCVRTHQPPSTTATKLAVRTSRTDRAGSARTRRWRSRTAAVTSPTKASAERRKRSSAPASEGKAHLHPAVPEGRDGRRLDQRAVAHHAVLPGRDAARPVEALDVAPVGRHEVAVPLVQVRHPRLVHERERVARGLELVVVQRLHEARPVLPGTGLSQPLPTTLNLFGSNLYFSMIRLRTASARS